MLVNYFVFIIFLIASFFFFFKVKKRNAHMLFEDLFYENEDDLFKRIKQVKSLKIKSSKFIIGDELSKAGLINESERASFLEKQKLIPIISVVIFALIALFLHFNFTLFLITLIATGVLSYIYTKQRLRNRELKYVNDLEYNLPLVMEKIVMAVEAGLDVISSLHTLVKLEKSFKNKVYEKTCPVTQLLEIVIKLTESGLQFEKALNLIGKTVPCSAIKHAFIYLGNAHRDGGELIMPLRELSDATQAYFQESIEVEVAKAPIKATLPLVLTFMGLIICFLTIPIIQVIETLTKSSFSTNTSIIESSKSNGALKNRYELSIPSEG